MIEESKNFTAHFWLQILFIISLMGVTLSIWGGSWDATSHLLRDPETFFTPSHSVLYSGVGFSGVSAIISAIILTRKEEIWQRKVTFGLKLIIIGTLLQIASGPGDYFWHEIFGIDGLLSPTHLGLVMGILICTLGLIIGIIRMIKQPNSEKYNLIQIVILPIAFGSLWFIVMWVVFLFTLPLSVGETFDFNPNPYLGLILSICLLPFLFSLIYWTSWKTNKRFGIVSISTTVFLLMNITSNIFPNKELLMYIFWFVPPLLSSIFGDIILNNHKAIGSKFLTTHSEKISGILIGSMFFLFSFPMVSMAFLKYFILPDSIFAYDALPRISTTIFDLWVVTIFPGAIIGLGAILFASKKIGDKISVN